MSIKVKVSTGCLIMMIKYLPIPHDKCGEENTFKKIQNPKKKRAFFPGTLLFIFE